eukprot:1143451-Pyramimonas_sp.AAC.1
MVVTVFNPFGYLAGFDAGLGRHAATLNRGGRKSIVIDGRNPPWARSLPLITEQGWGRKLPAQSSADVGYSTRQWSYPVCPIGWS